MKKNFLNKRRKKFFYSKKILYLFLFFFSIFFFYTYIANNHKVLNQINNYIENYSKKYQYVLSEITITGLNYINEEEILKFFNLYKDKSIFLIPIGDIMIKINENNWIKSINIRSNYNNKIIVNVEEHEPLGVYFSGYHNVLFSKDLKILEILIDNDHRFSKLVIFEGENSMNESKILFDLLSPDFINIIKIAKFINNRRWNLKLDNNILLKLPEKNIEEAINNYKKIFMNFSNNELNDIESIDLRMKQKAILRYKEN